MKKNVIIAVDGPAGSGKSSVSMEVALRKGIKYIDSGAIYRAITWFFLEKYNVPPENIDFIDDLEKTSISQVFDKSGNCITCVDGRDVSESIRDDVINRNIGIIADNVAVRNYINRLLRSWSEKDSIIMDGRDVGTVIFPDADLKIYLDASVEVRANRRIKDYSELGKDLDENSVKKQIIQRDEQDRSRKYGALIKGDDAVYIDTTGMKKEEVIEKIIALIDSLV